MPKADKSKVRLGKSPKALDKLKPEEIQSAGEEGLDPRDFLRALGVADSMIDKIILYPKWIENYNIGYAKYKIQLQRYINQAMKDGDTQIVKELLRKKSEESENEGKVVVTIRGKDFLK